MTAETYLISWKIITLIESKARNFEIIIRINKISITFLLIVTIVTLLITFYREMYIESYNNKKFFYFIVIFLISIAILVTRASIINIIIGWEFLGISSLILIIFYPNKTGKVNSIMTIIFNRIGDVIIIITMGLILININAIFNINRKLERIKWVMILIIICRITKRAQFPITAWLPAAISAPTPISAIVHSSTLVTAGIFLIIKINQLIINSNLIQIITAIRLLSFLGGGLIANREQDYKKIIAFSTIRQVSLIILITTLQILELRLMHIINHALFKTLVFCSSGMGFIRILGNQRKIKIREIKRNKIMKLITTIRLFRITGLIISSSFKTKDIILERNLTKRETIIPTLIITARIMTLLYCCKLIKRTITNIQVSRNKIRKNYKVIYLRTFTFLTLTIINLPRRKRIFWKTQAPVRSAEIIVTIIILILPLIIETKIIWIKILTKFIIIIKLAIYRIIGKVIKRKIIKETTLREIITLKIYILRKPLKIKINSIFIIATARLILKIRT